MRAIAFIILLFFNLVGLSQNSLFDSKNLCFDDSCIENVNIQTAGYYKVPIVINNDTIYRN